MARPILYFTWALIKQRCLNTKCPDYKNYGGRGITLCDKWIKYEGFAEDMVLSYKTGLTLERTNNDKGYCKENCTWATKKQQGNNTRRNRLIEYLGVTKTLSQWGEYFGIKGSTLRQRFYVYKWSLDDCFIK